MQTELVKVGHKYFTKSNDLVEIVAKAHVNTDDGHTHHYDARVLRAVAGHAALMGKVMHYDAQGRWLHPELHETVDRCIHDLKEEACHDAE